MAGQDAQRGYGIAQQRIADAKRRGLTALDLSDLGLAALPPEIGSLTALQRLDLRGNQLPALPPEIGSLTALQTLDLESNQLTALPPEIGLLTALQRLDLHGNQLTALPPEIGSLTKLQELYLAHNQLPALPPEIGSLTALQKLMLLNNHLTALPPEIGSPTALQTLDLESNQLTALPPEIGLLTALQRLDLHGNQLTALPPEIGSLTALQVLFLLSNQLTALPPEIGLLTALQWLYLNDNQLTALPPEIGSLTALQVLNLANNQLTALPPEIGWLTRLEALYLQGNGSLGIPDEILGPTWSDVIQRDAKPKLPRDILEYYFSTRDGARALREVKLILVGRGEVGKTTLADVLQGKPFKKNRPATQGIKITPWTINPKGGKAVLRIWDFGGQEIMHGTHQFFLTKRAIYVVMVDGRDDRSQREAEYWLKLVRAFGADSNIVVVMNRQENYPFDLDRNALATKYGVSTDLFFQTECSKKRTITPVRNVIERLVGELLSLQANFPEKWWAIKTRLEQMNDDHLSDKAYRDLCASEGISQPKEQDELLDRLNDLGTIVHFTDDSLAELKVLNPEWATDGVYRVVTNEKLREEKHGKLRAGTLKDILPQKRWPEPKHRRYIIDLMQRFDLCFPAEDVQDLYIVPELLPEKTPGLAGWNPRQCVVFRYAYPVLPHGVLPRFISKTHMLSEGRDRWRSGVIVAKDGAEALVRADYDESTVDTWVRGEYRDQRRALLTIIRSKFDEIHGRIKGLNPEQMVGVPGHPAVFVSYRDMILDERAGIKSVRVTIEGKRTDVPLNDILTGVESEAERINAAVRAEIEVDSCKGRALYVAGDLIQRGGRKMRDDRSIHIGGDVYGQVGQTLSHCTNMIQQQAPGKQKKLLEELREQVEQIVERLPEDKKEEMANDFKMLVEQATSEKPNRKWYSVSADGLLEASQFAKDFTSNIAGTIGQLGKVIWPDYSIPRAEE